MTTGTDRTDQPTKLSYFTYLFSELGRVAFIVLAGMETLCPPIPASAGSSTEIGATTGVLTLQSTARLPLIPDFADTFPNTDGAATFSSKRPVQAGVYL